MSKVFYVGQTIGDVTSSLVWEMQGIFSTEVKAIEACIHDNYFVVEMMMDMPLPHESVQPTEFTRAWYPKLEEAPNA